MGTELNIAQGLYSVNMAFRAWASEVYASGQAGAYSNYTQTIESGGEARIQLHFLTNAPTMRKWLGARQFKALRHYSQTIAYDDYEATLALPTSLVDMDQAGVIKSLMPQFLEQLDALDSAVATAYDASSGAGPTGFDGVSLFSASHPHSSTGSTQSNLAAGTNLNHANLAAAEAAGLLFTQENGRPCKVNYTTMRVGPQLKRRAMELLSAQRVATYNAAGAESAATVVAAATRSSTYEGDLRLIVDDRVSTYYWDLIDDTKGGVRPMVLFMVQPPEVVERTSADDPHVFNHKEYIYGVQGRWGVGAGHWYTCYRGTGTA